MVKEYYHFIKDYLVLAEIKTKYIVINFLSAFFYKGFSLLLPFVASLIVRHLTLKDANMTYLYLGVFIVVYILYYGALFINYKVYGFNMSNCYDKLQTKVLNKLMTVDSNFTRYISKGRLMNSINGDIRNIGDMNDRIAEVFTTLLQIFTVFVIVSFYNLFFTILLVLFTFIYITIKNQADRKSVFYHNKVVVQVDKYTTLLTQMMAGLQEIKTFNMVSKLKGNLNTIQTRFAKYYGIKRDYFTVRDNDVRIVTYTFRFILYVLLIYLIGIGRSDVSVLVLIVSYHESLVSYIDQLISCTSAIREVSVSVNRVNDILNYTSEIVSYGNLDTNDIYGNIEFKNVSLKLKNQQVLQNINLKIDHNEVVAIVGETGSGKTMLFNLLLRLYQPTRGKITLDNIDIYDFSKKVYAQNVSIANQKPFIFNMSIRKNLDFVDDDIDKQKEACRKAGIHDFIESLPNGYNTILRENGSNISGGQKQMISIARTILSDAEVLLLDDITTSLDPDTAKLVPKLIHNLKKDHTVVMITKKPDFMKLADKIVVLDKGRIVAVGSHKNLLESNEIYQVLQSRKSPSRIGVFDHD